MAYLCMHLKFYDLSLRFYSQGRIQDFFRRGCTRLLLYFNTNKPHSLFFGRIPVVLENGRSFQGGAHPLHPPPRSAPDSVSLRKVIILENQTNHNIKNIPFCKNPAEFLTQKHALCEHKLRNGSHCVEITWIIESQSFYYPKVTKILCQGGEWYLEKRGSRKILSGSRNLVSVYDKSRSLVFSWFVFTFLRLETFYQRVSGSNF